MKPKSAKLSFWAIITLLIAAIAVLIVINQQTKIIATAERDNLITHSIPFKLGENELKVTRPLDLSQRVIGLNGSLITIEEAKRRGVIEGVFDKSGTQLDAKHLLTPKSSFIIKVKDIGASPALFY